MRSVSLVAHRGFWHAPTEKNSPEAFSRAIAGGFGIETDLRDQDGVLVISHDPPKGPCLPFARFLELIPRGFAGTFALNMKSDGLQALLRAAMAERRDLRYFAFDMSIPDALGYARAGLPFYTRESEYEPQPCLLTEAKGVWIDQFKSDWIGFSTLECHVREGRDVCIVSPELHGREPAAFWAQLKAALGDLPPGRGNVSLCTDYPTKAREFFA